MIVSYIKRAALLLLLWWALTGGQGWAFGLPLAMTVSAFWVQLAPPVHRIRLLALLSFGAYFLQRSTIAGLDVAARLLARVPRISPIQCQVTSHLPAGAPQTLLANTLSLLPGTLSVALVNGQVVLHCLDDSSNTEKEVRALERRIAGVFGLGGEADE